MSFFHSLTRSSQALPHAVSHSVIQTVSPDWPIKSNIFIDGKKMFKKEKMTNMYVVVSDKPGIVCTEQFSPRKNVRKGL